MAWEPSWGICSWGYELFGPADVAAFRRSVEFLNGLPFPASDKPRVIEVFASMDAGGHEDNLKAAREIEKIASDNNVIIHGCGFNPPPKPHLTSRDEAERKEAIARYKRGIEWAAAVAAPGKGVLMGPSYMQHKYFGENGAGLYDGEKELFIKITREEIAPFAADKGVIVANEPLNRFEGYVLMPGEDALRFVEEVNHPNIRLNIDTVHWQMEAEDALERSFERILRSGYVADVHLSDAHRKRWGSGDIGARAGKIYEMLALAGYTGAVVQEDFCKELHAALGIWRPERHPASEALLPPSLVILRGAEHTRNEYHRYKLASRF